MNGFRIIFLLRDSATQEYNTTLEDIWGVHPQICVFPATKLLFKKLQPKQQQQ